VAPPNASQLAGKAFGAVRRICQAAAGTSAAAAGLASETARAGARAAGAATGTVAITTTAVLAGSTRIAAMVAVGGVRTSGRLLTGSGPFEDGEPHRLAEAAKAMFEPPRARRSRRVWASSGRAHVELAAATLDAPAEVRRTLRRRLERLDGVEWAAVNDIVGRVLVALDDRRISVNDVVNEVAAFEQARGEQIFVQRDEHPADLEPLVAAAVMFVVDVAAVGVAYAGTVLRLPTLTRHSTAVLPLLDLQPWITRALSARIGTTGTGLVITGVSGVLHAAAQSPTVPALYAVAAAARIVEVSGRRAVWQRREPQLCRPAPPAPTDSIMPRGERSMRPGPLPNGPIEAYRSRLGPWSLGGPVGLLVLVHPSRSADLLKALSPQTAVLGREVFAAVLDHLMCRRGVLPMDASAYRRLDRIDAVVLDSDVLCGAVGLDPLAEALLSAVETAGHRLVLTEHAGIGQIAGRADEIAAADEPLVETVRRLQAAGHGVLAVSARDGTALMVADVGVAVSQLQRPPWGADLVTEPGLDEVWRLVKATTRARALSQQAMAVALIGNVFGGLLASVGRPSSRQRMATTPGKSATAVTMAMGMWSAVRLDTEPVPPPSARRRGQESPVGEPAGDAAQLSIASKAAAPRRSD
jgi:cation-transporting ATPase I